MLNKEVRLINVTKAFNLFVYELSDLESYKGIYVYCLQESVNDGIISSIEGVTNEETLLEFEKTGLFKNKLKYKLVDVKELTESLHKTSRTVDISCYVKKPYTDNIVIEDIKDFALIINTCGVIKDYIGTYHAIGHPFNSNNGISENNYNLEELLDVLKKRDDIIFMSSDKIVKIPYHNRLKGKEKTILFLWYPSEADYNTCIKEFGAYGTFNWSEVPEKFFGVKKIKH